MLSVLIETKNDEEALARTLASLVGAAVEGIVREVIVCDRGSVDQTRGVAEHAGCHFLDEGGIAAGTRVAKAEWLLMLEPGAKLADGWTEDVLAHVAKTPNPGRFTRVSGGRRSFFKRLLSRDRALAGGLLIRKGQALDLARNAASAEALARGVTAKRLKAEILSASCR